MAGRGHRCFTQVQNGRSWEERPLASGVPCERLRTPPLPGVDSLPEDMSLAIAIELRRTRESGTLLVSLCLTLAETQEHNALRCQGLEVIGAPQ